ncbi:MAG TPA: agmatine deiminase family protein, partial [Candidatus Angelobacter sp.]|nr:agmatine deiminase family protein [Candidatus Angelobacter sp.]
MARAKAVLSPSPTPHSLGYRMPAEWEPHAATWLAWPHNKNDWPGKFEAIP